MKPKIELNSKTNGNFLLWPTLLIIARSIDFPTNQLASQKGAKSCWKAGQKNVNLLMYRVSDKMKYDNATFL